MPFGFKKLILKNKSDKNKKSNSFKFSYNKQFKKEYNEKNH